MLRNSIEADLYMVGHQGTLMNRMSMASKFIFHESGDMGQQRGENGIQMLAFKDGTLCYIYANLRFRGLCGVLVATRLERYDCTGQRAEEVHQVVASIERLWLWEDIESAGLDFSGSKETEV